MKIIMLFSIFLATNSWASHHSHDNVSDITGIVDLYQVVEKRIHSVFDDLDEGECLDMLQSLEGEGPYAKTISDFSESSRAELQEIVIARLANFRPIEEKYLRQTVMLNFGQFVDDLSELSRTTLKRFRKLMWYNTRLPHGMYNYAFTDRLVQEDDLNSLVRDFGRTNTPFYFCTGLLETTKDSRELLERAGLVSFGNLDGLCFQLSNELPQINAPDSCDIRVVQTAAEYQQFARVMAEAAGIDSDIGMKFFNDFCTYKESKFLAIIAYLEDRPVGCCMLLNSANGVAGNYFDWVVPNHRRKGIGSAMTLKRMQIAKDSGKQFIIAQCMSTSSGLYQALGFKKVCELGLYGKL